jgi:hypothetical protein
VLKGVAHNFKDTFFSYTVLPTFPLRRFEKFSSKRKSFAPPMQRVPCYCFSLSKKNPKGLQTINFLTHRRVCDLLCLLLSIGHRDDLLRDPVCLLRGHNGYAPADSGDGADQITLHIAARNDRNGLERGVADASVLLREGWVGGRHACLNHVLKKREKTLDT